MATLIKNEFGDLSSAKKIRSGNLFIECKSITQWETVLRASYFGGVRVLCQIRKFLRESGGVIYGIDLSIEIDDMKSHFADVGVVDACHLTTVRDGVKVSTTSVWWFCPLATQSFPQMFS